MSEKKNHHTAAKVVTGAAIVGTVAYTSASYYIFSQAFDFNHSKFQPIVDTVDKKNIERNQKWLENCKRSDEYITSYDRVQLHGYRIWNHPENHKWILIVHGFHQNYQDMMDYMYEADQRGYNVLAIDERSCGLSKGKYHTLGWCEHYDIVSWTAYLTELDPLCKIAYFGVSSGASSIMAASGEYLPSNVKCVVEDSGYANIKDELKYILKHMNELPTGVCIPGVNLFVKQLLHFSLYDVNIADQLSKSNLPMLFIHTKGDSLVPEEMMDTCYQLCKSEKAYIKYDGYNHGGNHYDSNYFSDVFNFMDQYISND